MSDDPFGTPEEDPFASAPQVSAYPKVDQLRGMLLLVKATKLEEGLLSSFSKPGKPVYQDRVTADVYVVDGAPDGFEGETEFLDMYFSQDRLVKQMKRSINGRMILGRLDTFKPGTKAEAGNPWGFQEPSEEDKNLARAFWRARSAPANPFA